MTAAPTCRGGSLTCRRMAPARAAPTALIARRTVTGLHGHSGNDRPALVRHFDIAAEIVRIPGKFPRIVGPSRNCSVRIWKNFPGFVYEPVLALKDVKEEARHDCLDTFGPARYWHRD